MSIILPDGREVPAWVDTTWGRYIHFEIDGKWKKIDSREIRDIFDNDLRIKERG